MYKPNITPHEFESVLNFLQSAHVPPEFFRSNLLFMLEKHFGYSVSSFWLVDEKHGMHDPISYNVDRRVMRSYEDYYYQFDPFHPIYMTDEQLRLTPVLTLDDIPLTQYPSTDIGSNPYFHYLSDEFSLTQDIILSFSVGKKQYGSAALFTKHSQQENKLLYINCLHMITPFIAQMLYQSLQLLDLKFKAETLESVVCGMDDGILMFDGSGDILYYNTQALRFCRDITGRAISSEVLQAFICMLLPKLHTFSDRIELDELGSGYRTVVIHSHEQGKHIYTARIAAKKEPVFGSLILPDTLSSREKEVAALIAQGKTNNEIAERLYISVPTVKTHISNIFRKMDVGNRTSLISKLNPSEYPGSSA